MILATISFLLLTFSIQAQKTIKNDDIQLNIESGNYSVAINQVKDLLKSDSLNTALFYKLGKLYEYLYKYNQAANAYSKAFALDSNYLKALLALAKTHAKAGKTSAAIECYLKLLQKEPGNIVGLLDLAGIYQKRKNYKSAFKLFERLNKIDSINSEYLRKMAICKIELKEIDTAFQLLKKAYSIDSSNIHVVTLLSKVYINSTDYDTALSIINKIIKQYPSEADLYALRGYAHFRRNHHFRSIPDYQKALKLGASSSIIKKNLGASLFAIEKYKEAKELLEQLLSPDTVDYKVCIYLGNIYNELGNPDKGIIFLKKSLELLKPSPLSMSSTYRGLQACYRKKGKHYKEIEMIKLRQKALGDAYYSPKYLLEIAEVLERDLNDKPGALKYYEKYYNGIKDANWYSADRKNKIELKINRLKEDIHFEK